MELEEASQGIIIKVLGGNGGSAFPPDYIRSIDIYSGTAVDSITINGNKHGGDGGGYVGTLVLNSDEYINKVVVRSGSRIDKLILITNQGRMIGGGGDGGSETILSDIRVVAIGGRSGSRLDQLEIAYTEL